MIVPDALRVPAEPPQRAARHRCRFCRAALQHTFVDLGVSPLANSYLTADRLEMMEPFYPLHVYVCDRCLLVQLPHVETPERMFCTYAYFSSYSTAWLTHAKAYTDLVTERFGLTTTSQVIEIASNDGYLLQYFQQKQVPVLGIEPALNVAEVAVNKGIPTMTRFFGREVADELISSGRQADLIVANNVVAHVPDLQDFLEGIARLLKPHGVVTMEFPHVFRLIVEHQFDTIYHEHLSYFSLTSIARICARYGLTLFDVEELPTHGGSLRIYGCRQDAPISPGPRVHALEAKEAAAGLTNLEGYLGFAAAVRRTKYELLAFLVHAKQQGRSIVGYGAPAKGNTLLNYCGVGPEFVDYTVDLNPHKQGQFLPGTRIPIHAPAKVYETRPDYVLVLPWNLKDEIMEQMAGIREWGGRFVVPIPTVRIEA